MEPSLGADTFHHAQIAMPLAVLGPFVACQKQAPIVSWKRRANNNLAPGSAGHHRKKSGRLLGGDDAEELGCAVRGNIPVRFRRAGHRKLQAMIRMFRIEPARIHRSRPQ